MFSISENQDCMKNKILVIYDDTNEKSEIIKDIIGNKGFGNVIIKKKTLSEYFSESLHIVFSDFSLVRISSFFEFNELLKKIDLLEPDTKILHFFSNFIISDLKKAKLSLQKINFIEENYSVSCKKKIAALMFQNPKDYSTFLKKAVSESCTLKSAKQIYNSFEIDGLINIGNVENFIQCITGNFDARFFNSLKGDEYTIIKSSANKKKIKAEYTFYYLLPDDMKFWFVMPFNYQETAEKASYTMERLHMTDLAVKWVHGSIGEKEFENILDKYFYFFKCRHSKKISKDEYQKISKNLYVDKVKNRIESLKKLDAFTNISNLMKTSCKYQNIDLLFEKYLTLKEKIESRIEYPAISVIGHGDPCFSNVMYNKATQILKFIDPKGALTEDELWTNPYYDVAKLSHSVCGRYDFFNNGLFEININSKFQCELKIDFDNSKYIKIFKQKLIENGFDYLSVRLYEASLFISMLPLHIDYPHKVFGFILNAINILNEIEIETGDNNAI